jgi:hypothetical protein
VPSARQLLDHALAGPLPLLQEDLSLASSPEAVLGDTTLRYGSTLGGVETSAEKRTLALGMTSGADE